MSDLTSMSQMNLSSNLSQASSYTDFNALAELRAKVTNGDSEKSAEATKEVAQQFESLFLQMMLKSMRDATYVDENSESDQTRFYQEMFDKQIALDLSNRENGGIGLAKIMEQQMSGGVKPRAEANSLEHTFNNLRTNFYNQSLNSSSENTSISMATNLPLQNVELNTKENWVVNSPQEFTQSLWPHANKVAEKLGVKPEVLIAQAALETGWGDKMIKDTQGNNANNLFGIKADARWHGNKVNVSTLEFRDGVAAKEQAAFRSYESIAHSFDDYAEFLQSNPRYQDALDNTGDANVYLEKLQQAGYSTDPVYAQKIQSITQRESFLKTVNDLKDTAEFEQKDKHQQMASLVQDMSVSMSMRGNK